MKNFWIGVITGASIGAAAVWVYLDRQIQTEFPVPVAVVRDIESVASYSAEDTASHRKDRFESLATIEEVMSLPTRFDRREALYAIAGRSDSAQLQHLIEQANRIIDPSSRSASLSVLFNRLSNVDPHTAIALASNSPFSSNPRVAYTVWYSWSKRDLDEALVAANSIPPLSKKIAAAEALYRAYGYVGSQETLKIESTLGIPPSSAIKARYLQSLANDSPEKAFAYINNVLPASEQRAAVTALGKHFGRALPRQAEALNRLLDNDALRRSYEGAVISTLAQTDPRYLLDRMMQRNDANKFTKSRRTAIAQLARIDINEATAYFAAETDSKARINLARGITSALAREDPYLAIEWAKKNDNRAQRIYERAILTIARDSPEFALVEIANIDDSSQRTSITEKIITSIAKSDPAYAAAALDRTLDERAKSKAAMSLIPIWAKKDPLAATAWMMQQQPQIAGVLFERMSNRLIHKDPATAIEMLPGLDREMADSWTVRIASSLAGRTPHEAAIDFVEQYRNSPNYEELQAAVIPQIARDDLETASQLASRMVPSEKRDSVYLGLISRAARSDPAEAAAMLNKINSGESRDEAVIALLGVSTDLGESPISLINSMSNDSARSKAKLTYIIGTSRNGPTAMKAAVKEIPLTETEQALIDLIIEDSF